VFEVQSFEWVATENRRYTFPQFFEKNLCEDMSIMGGNGKCHSLINTQTLTHKFKSPYLVTQRVQGVYVAWTKRIIYGVEENSN